MRSTQGNRNSFKYPAMAAVLWAVGFASGVQADTLTVSIVLPSGAAATPGVPLPIEVHGLLTNDSPGNDGLAFFTFDVAMTGPQAVNLGTAINWDAPGDGSMDKFRELLGYDGNYAGTIIANNLAQAGGAQNTIGNDPSQPPFLSSPSADAIDFDVAHTNQVLLEGTITFPIGAANGGYTINASDVMANVLSSGQSQVPFGVYAVEEATGAVGAAAVITVGGVGCTANAQCIDIDVCTLDRCVAGSCVNTPGLHADVAVDGTTCGQDGDVGLFDLFAMLDAFTGVGVCDDAQADIQGADGSDCSPNGDVDLFDIFAVLDAFSNSPSCSCP